MKRIIETLFTTSLVSYAVFTFAEYMRPGFVSHAFSLHWFVLPIIFSGAVLLWLPEGAPKRGGALYVGIRMLCSTVLFLIVWQEGAVFGDVRVFAALVAALLPWVIGSTYEHSDEMYEQS